ncbi:hypothetical protein RFI_25950 [Reticulomyxa filosa]|uniref:Uncharacterized protein n=1 Tax=Reticulomyxa filosa TaxID=46433 RepID=X6MEG7_RETFI|nr:hypothetical protein RFI_25950 [Reticulomyxa filosa]|eukprot:ETO11425.1 hypothetical protein RFI_25950 [Reticulomyxa filosa]
MSNNSSQETVASYDQSFDTQTPFVRDTLKLSRLNNYIYVVHVGSSFSPTTKTLVDQCGYIILSNSDTSTGTSTSTKSGRKRGLFVDVMQNPCAKAYTIFEDIGVEIAGVLFTHRHVLTASDMECWHEVMDLIDYPNTPVLLHSSDHHNKQVVQFNPKMKYQCVVDHPLMREFQLTPVCVKGGDQTLTVFYHRPTGTILCGNLAIGKTEMGTNVSFFFFFLNLNFSFFFFWMCCWDIGLGKLIPEYLHQSKTELAQFWKAFENSMCKHRIDERDVKFFACTHGEPVDLQKENISLIEIFIYLRSSFTQPESTPSKAKL